MVVERLLALATVLVLAGTFPVSVVAARGFRGAPFGAVLRPLPVVVVAYIAMNVPGIVDVTVPSLYYVVTSLVAVGGVLVAAAQTVVLLTERRKL